MKEITVKLTELGCDTKGAIYRMVDDEDFYISMLEAFVCDENALQPLLDAIDGLKVPGAFDEAHALKGVSLNLGLTPISNPICRIVEILRLCNKEATKYGMSPQAVDTVFECDDPNWNTYKETAFASTKEDLEQTKIAMNTIRGLVAQNL